MDKKMNDQHLGYDSDAPTEDNHWGLDLDETMHNKIYSAYIFNRFIYLNFPSSFCDVPFGIY